MIPEVSAKQTASIHLCEDMVPEALLLQESWWNQGALHRRPPTGVIYAVPIHTHCLKHHPTHIDVWTHMWIHTHSVQIPGNKKQINH